MTKRLPEVAIEASYYLWKASDAVRDRDDRKATYKLGKALELFDEAIEAIHDDMGGNNSVSCRLRMRGDSRVHVNSANVHWLEYLKGSDRWNYAMFDWVADKIDQGHHAWKLIVEEYGYEIPRMRDYAKYGVGGGCC